MKAFSEKDFSLRGRLGELIKMDTNLVTRFEDDEIFTNEEWENYANLPGRIEASVKEIIKTLNDMRMKDGESRC